ncbi:MAG: proton-conducting transporter membrane subunit [Kiritimatiellia bacterium]|nr:proton-conducting transporter membrane subunit [Kiritimatiellia bacterium]
MSALLLIVPLAAVLFFNLPFSFLRKGIIPFGVAFAVLQAVAVMFWPEELIMSFILPLSADGLSRVMLLAIAIVVAATLLVGRVTMPDEIRRCNFANLVMLAMIGMNGVVLCADLFSIYVFVEIAAVASFILIASEKSRAGFEGAFKYFVLSAVASISMLTAIALLFLVSGSTGFAGVAIAISRLGGGQPLVLLALALFIGGLFIKAGLVPFHGWVPDAYASAPSAVSVLLAGIVTKTTGVYVLIRLVMDVLGFNPHVQDVLMLVGALTLTVAAFAALVQTDMKRMLAYSSISQVGYIILSFGTGTPLGLAGAVFHLFNHAIFKSLLFVNAAAVEKQTGLRDMNAMGGLAARMPLTGTTSVIGLLSTAGVPPLAGFWSKLVIILALWQSGHYAYASIAVLTSLITLAYFLIMQRKIFFGLLRPGFEKVTEAFDLAVPTVVLAAITVAIGLIIPVLKGTFLLPLTGF